MPSHFTSPNHSNTDLQALKPREGLKEDFAHLFTFSDVSNAGILKTIFYLAVLKVIFCGFFKCLYLQF